MMGRKTLAEVRAELEAALGTAPAGDGQVAESLRRFLAAGTGKGGSPIPPKAQPPTKGARRGRPKGLAPEPPPAAERDR